jgi:hypothetical protein
VGGRQQARGDAVAPQEGVPACARGKAREPREARVVQEATRRRVLAAAAVTLPLVVSGCKGVGALGSPPKPAPDVAVVSRAITVERYLIARYGAVLAAVPGLAGELHPLLAQHTEHLARLRARLISPRTGAQPAASPAEKPSLSAAPPPRTRAGALAYLRDAENAAADSLLAHLDAATPSLAQLLASISASEATHAQLLSTGAQPLTTQRRHR